MNTLNFETDKPFFHLAGIDKAAFYYKKLGCKQFVGVSGHFGKSYFFPEIKLFCTYISGIFGSPKKFGKGL